MAGVQITMTTPKLPPINLNSARGGNASARNSQVSGRTLLTGRNSKAQIGKLPTLEIQKSKIRKNKAMSVQERMFSLFDVDGSGKIAIAELKAAKKALGNFMSDEQLEDMINNVDANEDGEIDYWEFCTKWVSLTGKSNLWVPDTDLKVGPIEDADGPGLKLDLVLPQAPPDGMRQPVIATERLMRASEAAEIQLLRQNMPLKLPGFDGPGDVFVDLRELPQLERVSAQPRYGVIQVVYLDLSRDKKFVNFMGDFFSHLPYLKELRLRGCSNLRTLEGISACSSLRVLDVSCCEKLSKFRATNSKNDCNGLRFLDMDGCTALSDKEAYAMVKHNIEPDPMTPRPTNGYNVVPIEKLQKCVPQCKVQAECPGKHMLARFDTEKISGLTCSVCLTGISAWSKIQACRTCHYYVCCNCCLKGSQVAMQFVWPSCARAKSFAGTLGRKAGQAFLHSNREGCREKWRCALHAGRAAMATNATGKAEGAREARRLEDISDAIKRADEEYLIDLPLVGENIEVYEKYVPEKVIQCFMGCGQMIKVSEWQEHQANCMMECPECGLRVRKDMFEHHQQVEKELRASLKTWNHLRVKRALHTVQTHCLACRQPPSVITDAETYLWHLQKKIKALKQSGVLKRGNVSIDFDNCVVNMDVEISFMSRQPPDATADITDGKEEEAERVMADLAVVVNIFQVSMVIEGHTGATEPADYWGELALNRAKLISETMVENYGVSAMLALPRGEPGGGAKVVVRPAALKEIFQTFDLDGSGMIDSDELKKAKAALGEFLSPDQVKEMILAADSNEDGQIDYAEFCTKFGFLMGGR